MNGKDIEVRDKEHEINESYREIADCCGVELNGFFLLDEDGKAEWISLEV